MKSAGVILLGGRAKRLGGIDKASLDIDGTTCFARVQRALSRSTEQIALSVTSEYEGSPPPDLPLILDWPSSDASGGAAFAVLGCLSWAQEQRLDFIVMSPVDTPFLQQDFARRLIDAYHSSERHVPIVARSGERIHGLHALWPTACLSPLKSLILEGDLMMIQRLHKALESHVCEFEIGAWDPFFNINTPADLREARRVAKEPFPKNLTS